MLPVTLRVCISYLRVYREHTLGMEIILPYNYICSQFPKCSIQFHGMAMTEIECNNHGANCLFLRPYIQYSLNMLLGYKSHMMVIFNELFLEGSVMVQEQEWPLQVQE